MLDSAGEFARPAGPQRRQLVFGVVWVGEEEGDTQPSEPGPQRTFFVEINCPIFGCEEHEGRLNLTVLNPQP
jgi:hypothetical protein